MSRLALLRRGVTSECLKANGKLPVESERLMIWVITGRRTDAQSFRREVGIGSNSHCLFKVFNLLNYLFSSIKWTIKRIFKRSSTQL